MVVPAQRISQRVHRCDRCVGKGLTGEAGTEQHIAARFQITAILDRRLQVGGHQGQGLACQHVGVGVLLQLGSVGLNGVHHGIDAGGRCDRGGQAGGQAWVEQGDIG